MRDMTPMPSVAQVEAERLAEKRSVKTIAAYASSSPLVAW